MTMEQLFNTIQTRIKEGMPELSLIDEDYGQLENMDKAYPVTFPCVLISAPHTEWKGEAPVQQGQCIITTRLCIDCYDDTHTGSGTEEKAVERMQMAAKLNRLLHTFRMPNMGAMVRKTSKSYTYSGGIKIYETNYQILIIDHP